MKTLIILLSSSLFAFAENHNYSLSVSVNHLRNETGVIQFTLYNKDGSLPDEKFERYYKQMISKIEKKSATAIFKHLPKGRYAVNILHDENENGKIDTGMFLPVEGVGLSNYKSINLMNRPNFEKASFQLNSNMQQEITINYF